MGGPAGLTTLLQKATLSLEELKAAARVSIAEKPDILTALPCQLPPPGSPPGLHTCSGWASSGLSLRICIHRLSPDINALELPVPHCVPPPHTHTTTTKWDLGVGGVWERIFLYFARHSILGLEEIVVLLVGGFTACRLHRAPQEFLFAWNLRPAHNRRSTNALCLTESRNEVMVTHKAPGAS